MALLLGAVGLFSQSASAHGERESTEPSAGESVKRSPKHVYINLTEAPSEGAEVRVQDGCGDEVPQELVIIERTLHSTLSKGAPGKWQVSYRAVSKVDGHATKDAFSFTVRGQKDCSEEEIATDPASGQETDPAAGASRDSGSETGSSAIGSGAFVVVLGAIGGLMLIGILWTVRSIIVKRED